MSDIIKLCPWFNHSASINHQGSLWWVTCDERVCGCGPARATEQEAIAAWNAAPRKPTTPAPNTTPVRLAIETDRDGFAAVWWVGSHEEVTPLQPDRRVCTVVVNAPLPEPAAEIEAEIEP